MRNYTILPATAEHNQEICDLFAIPMEGMISLSKERSPDFFAGANIQNNFPETYIYKKQSDGEICAVCSLGRRDVYVDGQRRKLQYMSDLRVHPKYQGGVVGAVVLNHVFKSGKLDDLAQTAVLSDNETMLKAVEKINRYGKKRDLSYYNYIGKIITCLLPLPRRQKSFKSAATFQIRQANEADIPAMQAFFNVEAPKRAFYPHYDFSLLNEHPYYTDISIEDYLLVIENDEIIGITGIWNQDDIWRTKVVSYDKKLNFVRPALNFFNTFKGGIHLPPEGSKLRNIYLHTILIKNDNMDVFEVVLRYLLQTLPREKYDQIVLSLSEYNTCTKALNKFSNKRILYGNYYLVTKDMNLVRRFEGKDFYMEVARI